MTMPRPQFTLRALLVLMLVAACFFGGVGFERERRRRADEAAELAARIAATQAELDHYREEVKGDIDCGMVRGSLALQANELQKKLEELAARK